MSDLKIRSKAEIDLEYSNVCASLGHLTHMQSKTSAQIDAATKRLRDLDVEAAMLPKVAKSDLPANQETLDAEV